MFRALSYCLFFSALICFANSALGQCSAQVVPTGTIPFCTGPHGNTLSIIGYSTPCTPVSYQWQKRSGTTWSNITGATASTYKPVTSGDYRAQYVTSGSITVVTDSIYGVSVITAPVIAVSPHVAAICTGTINLCGSGGVSYQWVRNGSPFANVACIRSEE